MFAKLELVLFSSVAVFLQNIALVSQVVKSMYRFQLFELSEGFRCYLLFQYVFSVFFCMLYHSSRKKHPLVQVLQTFCIVCGFPLHERAWGEIVVLYFYICLSYMSADRPRMDRLVVCL